MNRNRLFYLDAARGLAILLVVLGHIWETDGLLPVLIYSFHVPLFFIISGILTAYSGRERRPLKDFVLSGLRGLILPYLFFELVFLVISGVRSHFDFSSQGAHIYDCLLLKPLNVPLWFLPTLFLAELLLLLLLRLLRDRRLCALLCLALYLLPLADGGHLLPDAAARLFLAAGFLAAGYFSSELVQKKNPPPAALAAAAAACGILARHNGKTGIYKLTFHNPLLFTVCALTGSFCVIFFLKKFRCPPLELIGRNSLAILGLHIIVLRVLQQILGLRTDSVPGGLAALAGICLLLAPVCLILNRFFPFLVGKHR